MKQERGKGVRGRKEKVGRCDEKGKTMKIIKMSIGKNRGSEGANNGKE